MSFLNLEGSFLLINGNEWKGCIKAPNSDSLFENLVKVKVNGKIYIVIEEKILKNKGVVYFQIKIDNNLFHTYKREDVFEFQDKTGKLICIKFNRFFFDDKNKRKVIPVFNVVRNKNNLSFSCFNGIPEGFSMNLRTNTGKTVNDIPYSLTKDKDILTITISVSEMLKVVIDIGYYHFFAQFSECSWDLFHSEIVSEKNQYLDSIYQDNIFSVMLYASRKTPLSLALQNTNKMNQLQFHKKARVVSIKNNKLLEVKIKIPIEYRHDFTYELKIQHRTSLKSAITINSASKKGDVLTFLLNVNDYQWSNYYWDLYLVCYGKNEMYCCRLKIKSYLLYLKLQYLSNHYKKTVKENVVYPYITQNFNLSLNYRPFSEYETKKYKRNEWIAVFLFHTIGFFYRKKNIWLVHEKFSDTAQDNSYYFFKYLKDYTEQEVYYVLKKDSPEQNKLKQYREYQVDFMSVKHLFLLLIAKKIVASESKGHGYAWRVQTGPIKPFLDRKPFVFLQHGVLGLKKLDNTFNANRASNRAELFITSSNWEKEIVHEYLKYPKEEIAVTGLARWDDFQRRKLTLKKKNQILIMPTWRTWLEDMSDEEFKQSDYFREYSKLLESKQLAHFLQKENTKINFYIHPKLKQYLHLFSIYNPEVFRIVQPEEEPLNQLLSESICLITDYSSLYWEALYQEIPTIFFQFDIEKYSLNQGSYLDLEKDFKEEHAYTVDDLIKKIQAKKYLMSDITQKAMEKFSIIDDHNSQRIYEAIKKQEKEPAKKNSRHTVLMTMLRQRYRDIFKP